MADYWFEHGQHQASADAIKARLGRFSRFVDAEANAGRLLNPFVPEHLDDRVLDRFRAWATADPIVARKKDGDGSWIAGQSRKRKPSIGEESVIQLKAALNHASRPGARATCRRCSTRAAISVTSQRTYRLSLDAIAELLDHSFRGTGNYAGHADRLLPLRRYLIAGICTSPGRMRSWA